MDIVYGLYVVSTGEKILEETATASLGVWQRRTEAKILRRKYRAERFREAMRNKDTIASWENADAVAKQITSEKLVALTTRIFKGYDRWFNERLGYFWDRKD